MKKKRIAYICLMLTAICLSLLLLLLKGWTSVQKGTAYYLSGHGKFDSYAAELMPRIEDFPQDARIAVIYRKESHLIESSEYLYLWVDLPKQQFTILLDQLADRRKEKKPNTENNQTSFYMLPSDENGETGCFCVGDYHFDSQDVLEITLGSSESYVRMIGVYEAESRVAYVFLRDDRGTSIQLDGLLRLNDFVEYSP